jgi:hypothetical protein
LPGSGACCTVAAPSSLAQLPPSWARSTDVRGSPYAGDPTTLPLRLLVPTAAPAAVRLSFAPTTTTALGSSGSRGGNRQAPSLSSPPACGWVGALPPLEAALFPYRESPTPSMAVASATRACFVWGLPGWCSRALAPAFSGGCAASVDEAARRPGTSGETVAGRVKEREGNGEDAVGLVQRRDACVVVQAHSLSSPLLCGRLVESLSAPLRLPLGVWKRVDHCASPFRVNNHDNCRIRQLDEITCPDNLSFTSEGTFSHVL